MGAGISKKVRSQTSTAPAPSQAMGPIIFSPTNHSLKRNRGRPSATCIPYFHVTKFPQPDLHAKYKSTRKQTHNK